MSGFLIVGLLVSTVLAGCFESKPGDGGPPAPTGRSPGGNHSGLNATLREVRWENCTGMVGIYEVPFEHARGVVPSSFVPYTPLPTAGATAAFLFNALQCDRVTAANLTVETVGVLHSLARVRPANSSWGEQDIPSRFSLDLIVTSAELGRALAGLGVRNEVAALERADVAPPDVPLGPRVHVWKFVSENSTVELEFARTSQEFGGGGGKDYYWFGADGPFRRADSDEAYDQEVDSPAGVLRWSGGGRTGQLFGTCCIPWAGQGFKRFETQWSVNETAFGS